MNSIFTSVSGLYYSEHLERSGRISGTILIIIGLYVVACGLRDIISHFYIKKTKYTIVFGKIKKWDKKTSHVKLSRKTDYYPTLEFIYKDIEYCTKCEKSFGEDTMKAFIKASGEGRFEIRVPVNNPDAAFPNYEMDRKQKLYRGIKTVIPGICFIALGMVFILTRHRG